jgi:two-component system LytT family response regulator
MQEKTLRIVHIEDEPDAQKLMQTIIGKYLPGANYIGCADSLLKGTELVLSTDFDLLLLDVQLPDGSGMDLLRQFPEIASKTILCTADINQGIEAVNLGVLYYLLKPFDIQEVRDVIEKYKSSFVTQSNGGSTETLTIINDKILIPDNTGVEILTINDIFYLEADNNYTKIYKEDKSCILSSKTLKSFEETLTDFIRVHRSFLVNINHIQRINKIDGGIVELSNNHSIKLSPAGREEIRRVLNI